MPISLEAFMSDDWEPEVGHIVPQGGSKYSLVYQPHPESGGAFGGRDNAAMALLGMLRKTRVPYEQAHDYIQWWNEKYCQPPLDPRTLHDKVGRAWVEWDEGDIEWATPGEAERAEVEFLDLAGMVEAEQKAGALTWIVENGIPDRGLTYINAPAGGSKSWVCMDLAKAMCEGGLWLDTFPVEQRNVLYIDEEMGVTKALPRLRRLGMPIDTTGFWYTDRQGFQLDSPRHIECILEFGRQHDIGAVIIDTLTRCHSLDENDNSQMRFLFKQFRKLMEGGISVIVAHHNRKASISDGQVSHERMRGAGEIAAAADMAYSIDKKEGYFCMETAKCRLVNEDRALRCDFTLVDDGAYTRLEVCDPGQRLKAAEDAARAKVLGAMGRYAAPLATIAGRVGLTQKATKAAVEVLIADGLVEETGSGKDLKYLISGA